MFHLIVVNVFTQIIDCNIVLINLFVKYSPFTMFCSLLAVLIMQCCKLYYFQVLCGITAKARKAVMDCVTKR